MEPKASRRETRRQETIERILDTAMRLVAEEGYQAFTIARLASELGYAVGALYRYFKGKDAILAALEMRVVEQLQRDFAEGEQRLATHQGHAKLDEGSLALVGALVAIGAYESLGRRRPTHAKLLATSLGDPRELLADEVLAAGILPPLQGLLGHVASKLDAAAKHGVLRPGDAGERSLLVWAATQGVLTIRKLGRIREDFANPNLHPVMITSLLMGWGTSAEQAADFLSRANGIVGFLSLENGVAIAEA
ncbi:MAG: helix-turn-helix transcriptional regulator [Sandaracinus sp.]|nr:helix-turn-helix transcriptional regulator [Sandaracinus sp.]